MPIQEQGSRYGQKIGHVGCPVFFCRFSLEFFGRCDIISNMNGSFKIGGHHEIKER